MTNDRFDALLDQDWSAAWEGLPNAPDLIPRPKAAQITLRLPTTVLARLKRVAASRALPYHALARSWIIDGVRSPEVRAGQEFAMDSQAAQLNIKLDQNVLDALKACADDVRRPYHRLARGWIEWEIEQAEQSLGLDTTTPSLPAVKELMVLLLHAPNARGQSAVRGMTRLQKLLFVIEQNLASHSRFYAFNFGPFNEDVNDAARALEVAGFTRSSESTTSGPPSFEQMMAAVRGRTGRQDETTVVEYELNESGHEAAERLRHSSPTYERLFALVESIRKEWDAPDLTELVDRVYQMWPKYAEKSTIREEVARRAERRRDG